MALFLPLAACPEAAPVLAHKMGCQAEGAPLLPPLRASFLDNAIRAQGLMDVALAFKSHLLTDRCIPPLFPNLSGKNIQAACLS